MKSIKLSGREILLMRALSFSESTPGMEVLEQTRLEPGDLIDVINGLLQEGYIETEPYRDEISEQDLQCVRIDVNSSYSHELKEAMIRRY